MVMANLSEFMKVHSIALAAVLRVPSVYAIYV